MIEKEAADEFLHLLQVETGTFNERISTASGDWIVKGFVDVFKNVYTVSGDTKVVSKLIELMLFPRFAAFAQRNNFRLVLSREQNHYPDLTFIDENARKFAVDLKSAYRVDSNTIRGMTLGAFTGYFRNRESRSTITFPYQEYSGHYVVGVVYSRSETRANEFRTHSVDELEQIPSVVRDLQIFAQPKYRIASDQPGSGNTKNIGAVRLLSQLLAGSGPFSTLGEEVFDDYWMHYLTRDMARAIDLAQAPYSNLRTYLAYKQLPRKDE